MSSVCEIKNGRRKEVFYGSHQEAVRKYEALVSKRKPVELYHKGILHRRSGR